MGNDPEGGVNGREYFIFELSSQGFIAILPNVKTLMLWLPCLVLSVLPAQAVVNISGNINSTPSGLDPGFGFFGNVGNVNGSSGIYLGDGWVLTANHVAGSLPATATFGGIAYPTQTGSWQRITNPTGMGLSTYTDMALFRLSSPPFLPTLNLSSVAPALADTSILVGNGRIQENDLTFWTQTVVPGANNDIWAETTQILANRAGYKTLPTNEVRWGVNDVASSSPAIANVGTMLAPVDVIYFTTSFDNNAYANEAQAVTGDSGGAAFTYNGSAWQLTGMMFSVATYDNQPGGPETAILGQQTAIADISSYRDQIYAIIPEPTVGILGFLGLLGLCKRRR